MKNRMISICLALILFSALFVTGHAAGLSAPYIESFRSEGADLEYWLTLPTGYEGENQAKKLPLILYLHGAGENGTNISAVRVNGIPKEGIFNGVLKNYDFITVSPQCRQGNWETWQNNLIILLDEIIRDYPVDTNRVYLTGLSQGGRGTWRLAINYPDRFAAIAPLAGSITEDTTANAIIRAIPSLPNLIDMPVFAFHGDKDTTGYVKYSMGIAAVEAVNTLKHEYGVRDNDALFYTYEDRYHDIWDDVYKNIPGKSGVNFNLYDWFLSHNKQDKGSWLLAGISAVNGTASVKVSKQNAGNEQPVILLAAFDDGKLIKASLQSYEAGVHLYKFNGLPENDITVKAFLLGRLADIEPLSESVTGQMTYVPDLRNAPFISCEMGLENTVNGLWQLDINDGITEAVMDNGQWVRRTNKAGGHQYMYFVADNYYVNPNDRNIQIIVTVCGSGGFNVDYESTTGYKNFGVWTNVSSNWETHTFNISDAAFKNAWGWNFRINALGSSGDIYVKNIQIKRLD